MANLGDRTLALLNEKQYDIKIVAQATELQYDWLIKFRRGAIKDPSVHKVQKLYEYLTGKPLFTEEK
jgi:hypothetical protein